MSATVLTAAGLDKVAEIQRLLDEAYDHYFEHSDGYRKSGEGMVQLHLGDYDQRDGGLSSVHVQIYSLFARPSRCWFDTIDEALAAVREWHDAEMLDDHPDPFAEWYAQEAEDLALGDPEPPVEVLDEPEPDEELPEPEPEPDQDDADF